MSGEADEDTMSAWGSLNSGLGSPAELGNGPAQSLRRRSSFGMQMSPFSEEFGPILPPDRQKDKVSAGAELSEIGGDGRMRTSMVDVVQHTIDVGLVERAEEVKEAGPVATPTDSAVDRDKDLENTHDKTAAAATSVDAVPNGGVDEPSQSPPAPVSATVQSTTGTSGGDEEAAPVDKRELQVDTPQKTLLDGGGSGTRVIGDLDARRRSNQDDQSHGSARSGSSITGIGDPGEGPEGPEGSEQRLSQGVGSELPPPAFSLSGSVGVDSAVSDAR